MNLRSDPVVRAVLPPGRALAVTTSLCMGTTLAGLWLALFAPPRLRLTGAAFMMLPWVVHSTWLASRVGWRLTGTVAIFWRWITFALAVTIPAYVAWGLTGLLGTGFHSAALALALPVSGLAFLWALWVRRRTSEPGRTQLGLFDLAVVLSVVVAYTAFSIVVPVTSGSAPEVVFAVFVVFVGLMMLGLTLPFVAASAPRSLGSERIFAGLVASGVVVLAAVALFVVGDEHPLAYIVPPWLQGMVWAIVWGGMGLSTYTESSKVGSTAPATSRSVQAMWPYAVALLMPPIAIAALIVKPVEQKVAAVLGFLLVLEILVVRQFVLISERRQRRARVAELSERAHKESDRAGALLSMVNALSSQADLDAMAETVVDELGVALPEILGISVVLAEAKSGEYAAQGLSHASRGLAEAEARRVWAALSRVASPADRVHTDLLDLAGLTPLDPRTSRHSAIVFPVATREGRRVGSICLVGRGDWGLTDSELGLVSGMALQLGMGVERASLLHTLERGRDRLRNVVEHIPEAVAEVDAEGRVLVANSEFASLAGVKAEALTGSVAPVDLSEASVEGGETSHVGPDGDERLFETRVIPLEGERTRSGARLVVLLDVTEARHQERRVMALTQELMDKERSRSLLLDRVIMTAEAERTRMATQVNEGVMQRLSALCLRLDTIIGLPESRGYDMSDRLRFLSEVRIELAETVADLRSLMATLRPPVLDERGVGPALTALARRLADESGLRITTEIGAVGKLDDSVENLVYRAAQECVTKAVLHGGPRTIEIRLVREDADLILSVCDDGDAVDPADVTPQKLTAKGHVGLASIIERVELAAGTVVVDSADARGTRFTVRLPRRSSRREGAKEDIMTAHTMGSSRAGDADGGGTR